MAGHRFTRIMTQSHMTACGAKDRKNHRVKRRDGERERAREMLINHSYCQTNPYLHLWPTRPLIPNNKQKPVNVQLIRTSSGLIPRLPVPVASASGWTSLLSNPNQALIYKLQTKTPLWFGMEWAGTVGMHSKGAATRLLERNPTVGAR